MKKCKIIFLVTMIMMCCTITVFADVYAAGESFITDIKDFLLKMSTPIAIIGVAFGYINISIAKGNVQKIEIGYKAIGSSIIGWIFLNGLFVILDTISSKYF